MAEETSENVEEAVLNDVCLSIDDFALWHFHQKTETSVQLQGKSLKLFSQVNYSVVELSAL